MRFPHLDHHLDTREAGVVSAPVLKRTVCKGVQVRIRIVHGTCTSHRVPLGAGMMTTSSVRIG